MLPTHAVPRGGAHPTGLSCSERLGCGGTTMTPSRSAGSVTRRDLLKVAGAGLAGSVVAVHDVVRPAPLAAQVPKRGGVFRFPGFDPPNFDPHQNVHFWTFIYLSLTHDGLVRHKAGPTVLPGT